MFREWNNEFNQFVLLIAIGAFGGWTLGYPGWGIAIISIAYSYWMLKRSKALLGWLKSHNKDEYPPESGGLWGVIFDRLYQRQRSYQEQIQQLQAIIARAQLSTNAIKDAVVLIDKHNNLEWWNDASRDVLGLRRDSDIGQPITNLLRDPRFIRYFETGHFDKFLEIPSAIESDRILQFQITEFGDGEHLLVARDITRLHNLEEMRKDFVANVSHELRTPLTVIKGYLETFLDSLEGDGGPMRKGMEQMNQQTQRMELLVNDLLLLSRLETENQVREFKPVAVGKMLAKIHEETQPLSGEKQQQVILETDDQLEINGDNKELQSAFSNLIVNAIKYTPEQGQITVRWWQDEDGAYMEVEDTGIGIEPKHIPRLTERFYRADPSRYAKTGGTGLGLAIVKHVLLHHKARLDISSEIGVGSIFTCHFPRDSIVSDVTTQLPVASRTG